MKEEEIYHRLSSIIIEWYNINKRKLPWRNTNNPYIIWVSEIILQQTRVNQGYNYFIRFIDKFPTVESLANADENEILLIWQGLGYYSRARNMHKAAKQIMEESNGKFPTNYDDLIILQGIGEYTASAIASFAYNESCAVVDGNVFRVLSRIFGILTPINTSKGKKEFSKLAQILLNKRHPGIHNQAIMEFGALQCVPVSPKCEICPFNDICLAYNEKKVSELPRKENKLKIRNRFFNYFDIRYKDFLYLQQRTKKDIWQNLYELALIETPSECSIEEICNNTQFKELVGEQSNNIIITHISSSKHVLTHQHIFAYFYTIRIKNRLTNENLIQLKLDEISKYPISKLVDNYFEKVYNKDFK